MSWETPKTDWTVNPKVPEPTDFNRIEGNIDFLKTDIETKKGLIVDAMNSIYVEADITDTFSELATAITAINRKRYASGGFTDNPNSNLVVTGLGFTPTIVIIHNYQLSGVTFNSKRITKTPNGVHEWRVLYSYTYSQNNYSSGYVTFLENGIVTTPDGFTLMDNVLYTGSYTNLSWLAIE